MIYSFLTISLSSAGVAEVTLNRPDIYNALNEDVILELIQAYTVLSENPRVRLVVLKGEGKLFCAGADIKWMKSMAGYTYEQNLSDSQKLSTLFSTISQCPKPTMVVVHGGAFGGGVGLTAVCDIAIASEETQFCLSEVRLGILPAVISPYLIRAMGERQTLRLTLTGQRFSADEAKDFGLIHEVVSKDDLIKCQEKWVQEILMGSPEAQRAAKQLYRALNETFTQKDQERLAVDSIVQARVSPEGQEGLQAFLSKKSPSWTVQQD